jgi:hypothetical protein
LYKIIQAKDALCNYDRLANYNHGKKHKKIVKNQLPTTQGWRSDFHAMCSTGISCILIRSILAILSSSMMAFRIWHAYMDAKFENETKTS